MGPVSPKDNRYTLRLFFCEPDCRGPGERVFDVRLGEQILLSGFDVFKEAGGRNRLVFKEFEGVSGTDTLRLTFEASKGKPVLSGLEVIAK